MASRSVLTKLAKNIPAEIRELLGTPPLVFGERPAVYYGMLASVAESIKPDNFLTWTLLKDWVDKQIEVARYRKFKSQVINEPRRREIQTKIEAYEALLCRDNQVHDARIRQAVEAHQKIAREQGAGEERLKEIDAEITQRMIAEESSRITGVECNLAYWEKLPVTERDLATSWGSWI
jgi:hypothetical protein